MTQRPVKASLSGTTSSRNFSQAFLLVVQRMKTSIGLCAVGRPSSVGWPGRRLYSGAVMSRSRSSVSPSFGLRSMKASGMERKPRLALLSAPARVLVSPGFHSAIPAARAVSRIGTTLTSSNDGSVFGLSTVPMILSLQCWQGSQAWSTSWNSFLPRQVAWVFVERAALDGVELLHLVGVTLQRADDPVPEEVLACARAAFDDQHLPRVGAVAGRGLEELHRTEGKALVAGHVLESVQRGNVELCKHLEVLAPFRIRLLVGILHPHPENRPVDHREGGIRALRMLGEAHDELVERDGVLDKRCQPEKLPYPLMSVLAHLQTSCCWKLASEAPQRHIAP